MHYPTLLKSISNFAILAAVLAAACSSSRAQSAAPSQNPTTQAAAASPPAMEAPPVLWIERQTVPRANQAAFIDTIHKQLEQFQEHQVVFRVLGLAGAAPSMDEFLFLIHFKSFAEMDEYERKNAAMPAEFQKTMQELVDQELKLSQSHQIIAAVFRADLSYGADAAAVARARLLWTCQFIVPAGHVPEFESDVHFLSDAYQKAGVDDHYFMYQELAGAESQTFIVLHPMKSLADWDKPAPDVGKNLDDAGKFRLAHIWKDETLQGAGISVDRLYVLRPDLSQTSDQFAAFDPEFWRAKK